jgi:hypothetical protein
MFGSPGDSLNRRDKVRLPGKKPILGKPGFLYVSSLAT